MATASINTSVTPITLTFVSSKRKVEIRSAGELAVTLWPIEIVDSSGHTWTLKSDDGATAVFTG